MRASLSLRVSSRRAWLGVVCVLGVVAVVLGVRPGAPAPARAAVSVTFTSTGSEQTFVVPAGVTSLHVVAIGAPGGIGGGGSAGGKGARVETDIAVTPGQTLYIEVGGAGGAGASGGAGGFNGGGGGGSPNGGGGGGASDVRMVSCATSCVTGGSTTSLNSRLVVAAGGGGSGAGADGGAGGAAGQAGNNGFGVYSGAGGAAGTLTAGGPGGGGGGSGTNPGGGGGLGAGGAGGNGGNNGGGGGGAGCYGGGGGGGGGTDGGGGGGGGSSCVYLNGTPQAVAFTLDSTGIPLVTLSYTPPTPTPTPTPTPAPAGPQLPPGFILPPIQTLITTLQPGCTRVSTSLSLPPNTPVSVFLGQFTPPSAVVSITRVDPVTGQTQLLYSTDPQAQVQGQTVGPGQTLSICVNSPATYTYTSP